MKKTLSVFTLAMINVSAVSSVRNWPIVAEYGVSSVFFFVLAAVMFLIPVSMVAAELATGWSQVGGVFVWVKEAFGHRMGFLAIWLLWLANVIYFPALLSFIAGTIIYVIDPALINNKTITLVSVIGIFWVTTLLNFRGVKVSGYISTLGVLLGMVLPGGLIIALGILWYVMGKPLEIAFTLSSWIPDLSSPKNLVFFSGILMALSGIEMSAVHARDVQYPQKAYPKALLLSAIAILSLYVLGVLAIACVVPQKEISLVAGSLQAFSAFVAAYRLEWLTPAIGILLAVGALGTLSTWIAGPSKGLLAAAQNADLPLVFRKLNKHGVPIFLLVAQASIATILSLVYLVMPTVNGAYWILNVMAVQLYIVMYVLLFAAAIRLRYTHPHIVRAYKIPGGNIGMWSVAGIGLVGCIATFMISFFPPEQILDQVHTGSGWVYCLSLLVGVILSCVVPVIIFRFRKHFKRRHDKL